MFQIDQYAYSNRLLSVHPGEKFVFAFVTMIICLASYSAATAPAVILLMSGAVILCAGITWRQYLKLMTIPIFFLLIGVSAVAFSVTQQPEGYLFGFSIGSYFAGVNTRDISVAALLFLKSLGVTSCLYFLSLTTPMTEIISVLRRIRVPLLFVELMSLIYRFIFLLMETADNIYISQSSRLGYRTFRTGYRSLGGLVSNLFVRSYHRSQLLFTTMSSRCYTGEIRLLESRRTVSARNIIIITIIDLLLILLTVYDGGGFFG